MKVKFLPVLLVAFILSCEQEKQPLYDTIIADALHQAITLEKLPNVEFLFEQSTDTIWIMPIKFDVDHFTVDPNLINHFPFHVSRWNIAEANEETIQNKTKEYDHFTYLTIEVKQKRNSVIVDIIEETNSPSIGEYSVIDRGRLTIHFKRKNAQFWVINNIEIWYG